MNTTTTPDQPTCRNLDDNSDKPCGQTASAHLAVHVAGQEYPTIHTMDLCIIHLMTTMMRNGIPGYEAVQVISSIGERIALDILQEERHERTGQ